MARFYGLKIINGNITIREVPTLWKNTTENWLKENNYVTI